MVPPTRPHCTASDPTLPPTPSRSHPSRSPIFPCLWLQPCVPPTLRKPIPGCPPASPSTAQAPGSRTGAGPRPHRLPQGGGAVAPTALGVLHAAPVGDRILAQHWVPVCVVGDATAVHLWVGTTGSLATAHRPPQGLLLPRPTQPHYAASLEFRGGDKGVPFAPSFGLSREC